MDEFELIKFLLNNGVACFCLAFFMIRFDKTLNRLNETLNNVRQDTKDLRKEIEVWRQMSNERR